MKPVEGPYQGAKHEQENKVQPRKRIQSQVALAAIKGDKTLAKIAQQFIFGRAVVPARSPETSGGFYTVPRNAQHPIHAGAKDIANVGNEDQYPGCLLSSNQQATRTSSDCAGSMVAAITAAMNIPL